MERDSISCSYSDGFYDFILSHKLSLVVSCYECDRLVSVSASNSDIVLKSVKVHKPMGIAHKDSKLVLATVRSVQEFAPVHIDYDKFPDKKESLVFSKKKTYHTGYTDAHECIIRNNKIVFVNTTNSSICAINEKGNMGRWWTPPFIKEVNYKDQCHLNDAYFGDSGLKYITALGKVDCSKLWRKDRSKGIIYDVKNNKVLTYLYMPHSPRVHRNNLYVCESGTGSVYVKKQGQDTFRVINRFQGLTRGLEFYKNYMLVGLSKGRTQRWETTPLAKKYSNLLCGICVINLESNSLVGAIYFNDPVREMLDFDIIEHPKFEIIDADAPIIDVLKGRVAAQKH